MKYHNIKIFDPFGPKNDQKIKKCDFIKFYANSMRVRSFFYLKTRIKKLSVIGVMNSNKLKRYYFILTL